MLIVHQIINTPVSSNCFVVYDTAADENCIIVDPGSEDNEHICHFLEQEHLIPEYFILTHEHYDHCWGVNDFRDRFPNAKLICSGICSQAIQSSKTNYSVFNKQPGFELKPADILLDDINWSITWQGHNIRFVPAQGHSAAGIVFFIGKYVFTGDSLIQDIKTVTKLKTASKDKLMETMSMLESAKGSGLIVCPGHGDMFELDGYDLSKMINGRLH